MRATAGTAPQKRRSSKVDANGFPWSEEAISLLPRVMKMDVTHQLERAAKAAWAEEIERAIDNVKRSAWDKRFRREWHKADSRRQWSADRKARWADWRERRSSGVARDDGGQPRKVRCGDKTAELKIPAGGVSAISGELVAK